MKKACLVILDGVGYNPNRNNKGDAVRLANMQNFERIKNESIYTLIKASGKEVGLVSEKDTGNSEVGHNAIGSGQRIEQGLALIDKQIETNLPFENKAFLEAVERTKQGKKFHLIGLLSNGRVHSDIAHLFKILEKLKELNTKNIKLHVLIDGRDVPPQSAPEFLKQLENKISELKLDATVADVAGRDYLVMDRYETNLEIIYRSYRTYVQGEGKKINDIYKELDKIYKANPNITDENIDAFILDESGTIDNGDGVLLWNYRGDRALELSDMFVNFKYVEDAKNTLNECIYIGMTQYDSEADLPRNFLITPPRIENTLTEWLSNKQIKQYSVTESVKFGHLTYYFNGNRREPFNKKFEVAKEIRTKVAIYNSTPKMQTKKIADDLIKQLDAGDFDFYKTNFSNPDMVGHTGDLEAAIIACKEADIHLGRVYEACKRNNVSIIILGDHGNAEEMIDEKGNRGTKHTANLVPIIIKDFNKNRKLKLGEFGLTNVASTICKLMEIDANSVFNESIIM